MKKIIKKIQALLLATVGIGAYGGVLTEKALMGLGVTGGAGAKDNSALPTDINNNGNVENEENDHDDEYGDDCDEEDDDDEEDVENNCDDNNHHGDDYEFGDYLVGVECGCYEYE